MAGNEASRQFYIIVGKNIQKYRTIKNYSLELVGEKVGVKKKTIQRYERGEIKIDMNRLADTAKALDVDISRLLENTESFLGVEIGNTEEKQSTIVRKELEELFSGLSEKDQKEAVKYLRYLRLTSEMDPQQSATLDQEEASEGG